MKNKFSSSIKTSLDGRLSSDTQTLNQEKSEQDYEKSQKTANHDGTANAQIMPNTSTNDPHKSNINRPKKHPGGRPTKESKGEEKRKKYSLTLLEATYKETLAIANNEGLSFSKYVERAIKEYKQNH